MGATDPFDAQSLVSSAAANRGDNLVAGGNRHGGRECEGAGMRVNAPQPPQRPLWRGTSSPCSAISKRP